MTETRELPVVREAVAVFRRESDMHAAIDALLTSGFDHADISLLASEDTVERELGHRYEKVAEVEDDPEIPRTAYVSPESRGDGEGGAIGALMYVGATAGAGAIVASGGTLAGAIAAAVVAGGAGGLIGSVLATWIDRRHAKALQEQIDHGGLVLWVHTRDETHEFRAREILERHGGSDIHVHTLPAVA